MHTKGKSGWKRAWSGHDIPPSFSPLTPGDHLSLNLVTRSALVDGLVYSAQ